MKVQWTSVVEPFAEGGDSGSLVFAKDGDCVSLWHKNLYALSLWSICEDISTRLDADSFFYSPSDLPASIATAA